MAATSTATTPTKLVQFRFIYRPSTTASTSIQFFSSSSSSNADPSVNPSQNNSASPPSPPPESPSSFSSYFSDVKAKLKQQQGNPQSQPPRSPFSFSSSSTSSAPRSSRISQLEEIRKNISEFRRRSDIPPPSSASSTSQPPQHFSFEELYRPNVASSAEESSSAGSKSVGKVQFDALGETMRQLRANTVKNQNEKVGNVKDIMSLSKLRESLNLKPGSQSGRDSTRVIGGSDNLPLSIFGKEMWERDGGKDTKTEFVRLYSPKELGEKLKSLQPEKKGEWFSLQELNERLMTLREIDRKEGDSNGGISPYLRSSIYKLGDGSKEEKKKPMPNMDVLRMLGRSPSYMLLPPQEHLVEKYFHPDNMSASEKLKLELKKVRDEFKMSESDCGSARVQVAQLTTKIRHLSTVLQKKDKHSRKGLQGMVQKRKTLLKYLRRTDWESYCFVLSKLGLRDIPDYKN